MSNQITRRRLIQWITTLGGLATASQISAHHTESHFDDKSSHQIVYQCNKADPDYLNNILFSAGEMLRKYGDDIEIVVVAIGPGIHLLGKHPLRPIPALTIQKAGSLAAYGVAFHACGNTMKGLHWTADDLLDFATIVPIGADDLMLLQEKGFAYISW